MKTLVFDLDGTMYRGTQIIESAHQFLDYCILKKIPFIFLTNNSMRTPQENVKHMEDMGYTNIEPSMFYNSAMAACQYVKKHYGGNRAYYEYIKLDRDKSTFKSHRDFSSEKEITFKHL